MTLVRRIALQGLGALLLGASAAAQQSVTPFAIEDAVGAVELQMQGGIGAISPDGTFLAYAACDKRRIQGDSAQIGGGATVNSAARSMGCEMRLTALADGATRTIAASERGGHWAPAWSPDGRRLAFLSDRDGVARVWLWERATGKLRRVSSAETRGFFGFQRPLWTPDGKALVVKLFTTGIPHAALAAGGDRISPPPDTVPGATLHLYRSTPPTSDTVAGALAPTTAPAGQKYEDFAVLDLETGRVRRLRSRVAPAWYDLSPDGRWLAYLEWGEGRLPRSELRLIELATGSERTLVTGVGQDWGGAVWSPNSRYLAYTSKPAASEAQRKGDSVSVPVGSGADRDADLYLIAVDGGTPRRFTGAPGPVLSSDYLGPLWTAGSDGLVVVGARKLWRAEPASGTIAEVPTTVPVSEIVRAADTRTYWSPDGGTSLYVLTTDSATLQMRYAAVNLKTGATRILMQEQRAFGRVFDTPLVTPQGDAVVYLRESASEPQDLWVAGVDFQAPRRLTTLNPQLTRYTFGQARLIEYQSHDGTPLRGALLLPAGYEPGKRYPLVVWVYASQMGSRNLNRFGLLGDAGFNFHMLTTRGYAVLWPDIPVNIGTPMRDLMKSVMPAIDKVVELGIADPERLAVTGQSNGGYSTLALLVQTNRFKAAVMNAGFGDLTGFYGLMIPRDGSGLWHPWLLQLGGAMAVPPWEAPLRYVENSPVFYLDRVQTPLIIQAGSKDFGIVPFSDQVYVGLKQLQKDVTYLRYEGEAHVLEKYPNLVDYWKRVIAFFDAKLKDTAPAAHTQLGR